MNWINFIYRQRQRLKYHTATNDVEKRIAEINQNNELIEIRPTNYFIKPIQLELPKGQFDFVFTVQSFDLLLSNLKRLNGQYITDQEELFFIFDQFKVRITSGSELFIINEIYVEKCYHFLLPDNKKCCVVDIGMNVGLATLFFAAHHQVERVFAFEPFLPTYQVALENLALNKALLSKVEHHNFGLGYKEEVLSVPFNTKNKGINSTLIVSPRVSVKEKESLLIKAADREINKIIAKAPDKEFVLKMDCEGAEYDIFKSIFQKELPKQIKIILLEWHYKDAKPLENDLLKNGFRIVSFVLSINTGFIYAFK